MKPIPTPAGPATELMARRTSCRACGGTRLASFLTLGEVPLANAFLTVDQLGQPEPRFPLEVFFCEVCSLVQLLHVVNPEVLFSNYLYRTGTNQTIARHNSGLAQAVVGKLGLTAKDLVVEVASNDGSLLQCFRERGTRTLGVEPARNIARLATEAGIETLNEFFNAECAAKIAGRYKPAAAVIANNVLAHVDATVEFLRACRDTLRPGGRIVIEVPYLVEMLERLEYDTIYHEHLCYFSVTALMRLFAEAGLAIEHIDRVEIHGGSLRIWGIHAREGEHGDAVLQMAEQERSAGLSRLETYREFARRTEDNRRKLLALLGRLKGEGKKIVGYGAPAKGNTLLCYCGIGTDLLPYAVDRSPLKVGLHTPGSHIPVVPFDRILEDQPDYVLILAWNFAPEIIESLKSYAVKGGQFILPIPEPKIVERATSMGDGHAPR
jgi:SAM-dependent methyltransferase